MAKGRRLAGEEAHAPPTARQSRCQEVIKRLLAQGLSFMARKGVQACRVEEITAAARVGKSTFLTHFASKGAFVAALVDQVLSDLARRGCAPWGWGPLIASPCWPARHGASALFSA
ncbi:hypothetical protein DFAR_2030008 [Desulfarculales bacterium]